MGATMLVAGADYAGVAGAGCAGVAAANRIAPTGTAEVTVLDPRVAWSGVQQRCRRKIQQLPRTRRRPIRYEGDARAAIP